jgi:penicillin-binding protein 1A
MSKLLSKFFSLLKSFFLSLIRLFSFFTAETGIKEKVTMTILAFCTICGGLFFGYITSEVKNFSGIQNLKQFQPSVPTKLYDVNGELISELFKEQRDVVSFEELPKPLINAFIATEDKEFYSHFGINPLGILRAMGKNIMHGEIKQGGSTITQQLAKRLFTSGEKKYTRKILEAILALQIEKMFSKDEILEMYCNQIFFGRGCYGVSSAATLFFNKDVQYITAAEASILAALPSAPGRYSPLINTHDAYEKNRDILNRMVREGYLTKEYADKIYAEYWPKFVEELMTEFPTKTVFTKVVDNAPYFTDYVRQILVNTYGADTVYNDGLTVYTTLDLKRQKAGEKYLREGVERQDVISSSSNQYSSGALDRGMFGTYYTLRSIFSLPNILIKNDITTQVRKYIVDDVADDFDFLTFFTDTDSASRVNEQFRTAMALNLSSTLKVEGALLSIEPANGYITAMVGGSGFSVDNQFNRAVQARRQPGSSFKPFIYGSGIEAKVITPATGITDAPLINVGADGETWAPGNYSGDYTGIIKIRQALMASVNIISIRIYDLVGPERVIDYASRMLKVPPTRFSPGPSLALGTAELTPFEMATGYAIYANRGRDVIPYSIRYVLDRDSIEIANVEEEVGNIIAVREKENTIQVIPENVAYVMRSMMQSVVDAGTASSAIRSEAGFKEPAAGKTGTTSNWTDAWFCGFTPDITTVVWVGYDKPYLSLGRGQAGASTAAPIWAKYMKEIYNGMKSTQFPPEPKGIIRIGVCAYTGKIPGPNCKVLSGDISITGAYPAETCDGNHGQMQTLMERYMEQEGLSTGGKRAAPVD